MVINKLQKRLLEAASQMGEFIPVKPRTAQYIREQNISHYKSETNQIICRHNEDVRLNTEYGLKAYEIMDDYQVILSEERFEQETGRELWERQQSYKKSEKDYGNSNIILRQVAQNPIVMRKISFKEFTDMLENHGKK